MKPLCRSLSTLAAALAAAFSTACVSERQYDAAVADLGRVRAENSAMYWRQEALARELALRDARLRELDAAQQYVQKLQELTALNGEMAKRLDNAQRALEQVAQNRDARKNELPPWAKSELDDLRSRKTDIDAQTEAYQKFVRNVQALVDSGRIRATMDSGRLKFSFPRHIDLGDPWQR